MNEKTTQPEKEQDLKNEEVKVNPEQEQKEEETTKDVKKVEAETSEVAEPSDSETPAAEQKESPATEEAKEEEPKVLKPEEEKSKDADPLVKDEASEEKDTQAETKAEAHHDEDDEDEDDHLEEEHSEEKFDELSREQLVEILEETVKETDISKIKTRVALIKVSFLKNTKEEQHDEIEQSLSEDNNKEQAIETDPLEERFNLAFSIYKQNKVRFNEELEKTKLTNLEAKKEILEELKELINSEETLKKTYDHFRELQERWKEVGMVPRSEVNNLWQSYHFLVEKFFDMVKINKELRDLDLKKNLESKIELCEKAEELLIETSIIKSFKELQKLHETWKDMGPVPADKKDEIWDRFKAATDKINERRREHYLSLAEQQKGNFEAKSVLCEKADEILARENTNMKDWQENTNEMNELFKVWRTIGPAPKKENDEIWARFKSSLNTFFENRKEYFNEVKGQQLDNYNLKLDLCTQAEAMQDNTDWKKTTDELIRLQKEWRKIGPVPRKFSDKIWKRFRAANDHFFNLKAQYYSNIHEHEAKNLEDKKALIEQVKKQEFGDDKNENLNLIKDFQRKWMDIGHVPIKEKEKLQNEFRKAIDIQLEKLKISAMEISTMNFKSKVESMKDDPNARKVIGRERNFLLNKINKLKEDINLWENNLGFLANSKKADVLKMEFNKKIDKAKQDLKVMEAKLKYLNTQG